MATTIPAVYEALRDLYQAAIPHLPISIGGPKPGVAPRQFAFLANATPDYTHPVSKGGRKPAQEAYNLDLVIVVLRSRGTVEEALDAACEYLDACQDALYDDVTLADAVEGLQSVLFESASIEPGYSDPKGEPMCRIVLPHRVVARLN